MKNARVRVRVRVSASASASASTSAFPDRLTPSLRHFGEATRSFLQEAVSVPGRLKRSAEQHRELGRPSGIQYIYIYIYMSYFLPGPGWPSKKAMAPGGEERGSSRKTAISHKNFQHYRESEASCGESAAFSRSVCGPDWAGSPSDR